ncbi:hypothetical protein GCM10010293_29240 [Streptomyces griseoflavus]|nr:hypothetical protein GCM10010293_29240 [Streptomyces griseoflavus]
MRVTHALLPLLRKAITPSVVNVTSGLGSFTLTHDPGRVESQCPLAAYGSSKSAGKSANAVRSALASSSISLTLGNGRRSMSATVASWVRPASAVGWAKIVRIARGDHLRRAFRYDGEDVADEVDPAALPGGAEHDLADRFDQTAVAVGDDQADATHAAFLQVTQELGPEIFALAVADRDADDFAAAVRGDAGGDDDGLEDDAVVDAGLDVGGVEEQVGEPDGVQRPGVEGVELFAELDADSGDLVFRYPGIGAEGFDQVVDRASGDAVNVGRHDDRVEGLVDAPPAFQQAGEEASGPQCRDRELEVAGLCGHGQPSRGGR